MMTIRLPVFLLLCVLAASAIAQDKPGKTPTLSISKAAASAKLVDEFGLSNSEERSARFDAFFAEISESPGSTGYVLLYCGKQCRYDEIIAHMRGIEVKIALRKFDRSRIVVQDAGFKYSFKTELWIAPEGSAAPRSNSELLVQDVTFTKSGKYIMELYDCCDTYEDVWNKLVRKP